MKEYYRTKHQGRFTNNINFWDKHLQVRQGKVYIVKKRFWGLWNSYITEWDDWRNVEINLQKASEK